MPNKKRRLIERLTPDGLLSLIRIVDTCLIAVLGYGIYGLRKNGLGGAAYPALTDRAISFRRYATAPPKSSLAFPHHRDRTDAVNRTLDI